MHRRTGPVAGDAVDQAGILLSTASGSRPRYLLRSWPIMMTRTPYGLGHDDDGFHGALSSAFAELARDGYIFVFQDIRGRFESEGRFVMLRPPRDRSFQRSIDEGTDTYDTIEWLLDNVEGHNGRVGIGGVSYGGWLTVMSLLEPHPALRAASPQASPSDMFIGDDFLHNGAFRLAAAFGYVALMETGKTNQPFTFDQHDAFEWYLDLGPVANVDRLYFHEEKPTWSAFMANTHYTDYWKRRAVLPYLEDVRVPTLNVAGWWDAEDFYGPMTIYQRLETFDEDGQNFLVVGPWRHGGWARGDGDSLGPIWSHPSILNSSSPEAEEVTDVRNPMTSSTDRPPSADPASAATTACIGGESSGNPMDLFRDVGFFSEKGVIEAYLRDFFESAKRHNIQASIMFGTLLGHLRHGDIIPWDDDVDIVIFNYDTFLSTVAPELEAAGYIVKPDIRDGRRMGCRICRRTGELIPDRDSPCFPWLGIWEHQLVGDDQAILPPEGTRYRMGDFLPLRWEDFVGTSVGVPNDPRAILYTYFETDDWMTYCVLPDRNHRNGGRLTNFPRDKFLVSEVLAHLAKLPRERC